MDSREGNEPVLRELLAADTVLPEQFWPDAGGSIHHSGERALMWAVFTDGIECYRRNAHARSALRRAEFKEAEGWVSSTDWDWPFSFVNLCEVFGLEPDGVRHALQRWKRDGSQNGFQRQRFRPVALHAA
jgi:hypothetical protein